MSRKELTLVEPDVLTPEEKTELNADIDRIIEAHKANRKEINRLAFESVSAMTEADEAQKELKGKGPLARFVGSITGSNRKLREKISENRAAAQYASQLTLQKLAEQNLMSFDLLAAVNNKLNASMQRVGEEFNRIYTGLGKFFQYNQNQLVKMELRMEKVERNVKLLTWQNSIEYLDFNGEEYTDMDDAKKIVCLVRDFYDITQGDYSTSDLLLLKAAMSAIEIEPKSQVNYGAILDEIAENDALKEKLLGGKRIRPVTDPGYLIAMSGLQKMDALQNEEKYTVDTVAGYVSKYDSNVTPKEIARNLTMNYLRDAAGVNVNLELDSFDMVLDLLYNLKQAEADHILVSPEESALALPEGDTAEGASLEEESDSTATEETDADGAVETELEKAERLYRSCQYKEAYQVFVKLADQENGDGRAMYYLGEYSAHGYPPKKQNFTDAQIWYKKGKNAGDTLASLKAAQTEKDKKAVFTPVLHLAHKGDISAQFETGKCYAEGIGASTNWKWAVAWYSKAAKAGDARAQNNLGVCYYEGLGVVQDYEIAFQWIKKAAEQGNATAQANLQLL